MTGDRAPFDALRSPFDPAQIGQLPRITCQPCSKSANKVCGEHTSRNARAAGTGSRPRTSTSTTSATRLSPTGFSRSTRAGRGSRSRSPGDGQPLVVLRGHDAVLWISLTVLGVSRFAVGIVQASAFELEKQLISDAIRNGAMRFGVALDLWAKEDLHADPGPSEPAASKADVVAVTRMFAAIVDKAERAKAKKAFMEAFGRPEGLRLSQVDAAVEFVGQFVPAEPSAGGVESGGSGLSVPDPPDDPAEAPF